MKKSVLILMLTGLSFLIQAAPKSTDTFVVLGDEVMYCDRITMGRATTRLVTEGNQSVRIPTLAISAYAQNGRFFEFLPVVNSHNDTAGWAYMQLVATGNGYRVYRYCSNCLQYDPVTETVAPVSPLYRYYVFKNYQFVSVNDDNSLWEQMKTLGIRMIA
jgi:hypothetical protein